jgi:hypothetical protein
MWIIILEWGGPKSWYIGPFDAYDKVVEWLKVNPKHYLLKDYRITIQKLQSP